MDSIQAWWCLGSAVPVLGASPLPNPQTSCSSSKVALKDKCSLTPFPKLLFLVLYFFLIYNIILVSGMQRNDLLFVYRVK